MISLFSKYLSLIKFSHTIFALPFAIIGFVLALHSGNARFSLLTLFMVLSCMVFARSAAMAFNRYIDRHFDVKNPRTAVREIPAGIISAGSALLFTIICSAAVVISTWFINSLCFYLSPVALFVVLGYSYTKRFTPLCHVILGIGLALAPIGAYIALTEEFAMLPVLFGAVVLFWVSGFDIIYALQDEEFDREHQLKSIPVLLGTKNALILSKVLHTCAGILVVAGYFTGAFSWLYLVGAAVFVGLLVYQHSLISPTDLRRVNLAFATTNGIASVIFSVFVCTDMIVY